MATRLPKLPNAVRGKDYIETKDWTVKELELALKTAGELKKMFRKGKPHRYLPDKTAFLFFFDKSTRTRNSFEAGLT
ncbi:MAG: ornithine carbamoyltransferase, partial [Ignavibacteriae bacterium]|nr:ornithine carbamoyltransferase [Ignavibacteriota bacterium]